MYFIWVEAGQWAGAAARSDDKWPVMLMRKAPQKVIPEGRMMACDGPSRPPAAPDSHSPGPSPDLQEILAGINGGREE